VALEPDAIVNRAVTVVVAVSLAAFAGFAALTLSPALRQSVGLAQTPPPPAYAVGEAIDVDPSLYQGTPLTLLVMARSTCAACQKSQPAYAEFVRLAAKAGIPARLATTERDSVPEVAFAAGMGIPAAAVSFIDAKQLRVTRVPLLFLIDSTGVIRHLWPSVPDHAQTADVRQVLETLGKGVE
jgi:hypothetical protein